MTDVRTEDQAIEDQAPEDQAIGAMTAQPGAGMPRRLELIRDPSTRAHVNSEPGPRFPFPIPNGWFIVAASGDVDAGTVEPLHYFGRDLVVFRTESGVPRVTAAYCAHLGAHLGVGGTVRGEILQCPFHGWCYDGESGKCTDIPYGSGKIPTKAAVRAYPTLERNGMVWAWHHLEGKPPFYDVPEVPELADPEWSDPYRTEFTVRTSCQEMAENNHDAVHFQFVHGTPAIPEQEMIVDGGYKRATSMDGFFVRESFGLGLGVLRMTDTVTFLSSTTPIDDEQVHVRWTFTAPKSAGPDATRKMADSFLSGVSQDIPIWENKRYVERPIVVKEERTILDHREWCKQFYSDPADAVD